MDSSSVKRPYEPLALAARDAPALDVMSQRLADYLTSSPGVALDAVGCHLATRLAQAPHRRVVFARDHQDAIRALRVGAPNVTVAGVASEASSIAFLFPGMVKADGLRELYDIERVFRDEFDRCAAAARRVSAIDLLAVFDRAGATEAPDYLGFLFAIEAGLSALWSSWGVRPRVVLGFSFGELVAGYTAGVFTLDAALGLVAERSRLLQALMPGAMTSVALSEVDTRRLLPADLAVAIQRTATSCVVSGPVASLAVFEDLLRTRDVGFQRLDMSFAGHSTAAVQAAEPFTRAVARVAPQPPRVPIVSGATGELLTAAQAVSPSHWGAQLHQTVRFASGVETLIGQGCRILLEVGPGFYLTSMASQQGAAARGVVCQASMRPASGVPGAHLGLLRSLARLWTLGVDVDWRALYPNTAPLPGPLPL
jgi:acyl transferase domain-containing protein